MHKECCTLYRNVRLQSFSYSGWTSLYYLIILAAPAFADIISLMMNRTVGRGILRVITGTRILVPVCYIIKTVMISRLLEILARLVAHRREHLNSSNAKYTYAVLR